ncbi:hypothetical protein H8B02_37000, partial [Bradyrhizobium sp. Pear77]
MANGAQRHLPRDLQRDLGVRVGFASETGKRAANEDYVAACLGQPGTLHRDVVAAVADGVGGHKG